MKRRSQILAELMRQHNLSDSDIYLLDLIPLIEMIWADGKIEEQETKLLYDFALKHVVQLTKLAHGEEVVSISHVNAFIERFIRERPDPKLLSQLRNFVALTFKGYEKEMRLEKTNQILYYCMDIAAACMSIEKNGISKIGEEEKNLLIELMSVFEIPPEREVS